MWLEGVHIADLISIIACRVNKTSYPEARSRSESNEAGRRNYFFGWARNKQNELFEGTEKALHVTVV